MDITYLGHSSFRIRGKTATLITDPYSPQIGLKFPRHVEAEIVTVSHEHADHNCVSQVEGNPFVIRGPGEYEIQGIGVVGFSTFHDEQKGASRGRNTIYRIEVDGVSIVHLGDLGHILSNEQIEALDGVNVVCVPVGGNHTLDAVKATKLINEIGPNIVIPMHYDNPQLNKEIFGQLQPVSAFLKEIGKEGTTPQSKLTLSKDKIPAEMQVVVLE
jgi:L-ascorbate metabolism protein UlaG (beta-lactamase superfamily)